jgi:hypothetical protein
MGPWDSLRGSQTPVFELTSDLLAWERSREKLPRLAWSLRADGVPMTAVDCAPLGKEALDPSYPWIRRRIGRLDIMMRVVHRDGH